MCLNRSFLVFTLLFFFCNTKHSLSTTMSYYEIMKMRHLRLKYEQLKKKRYKKNISNESKTNISH